MRYMGGGVGHLGTHWEYGNVVSSSGDQGHEDDPPSNNLTSGSPDDPDDCYDPARLCPGGIGPSFLERSGLVQIVRDPRSTHLFVRPTFHAVYVTSVKAWHTSFFLYPCLGHNLTFVCPVPSDPFVLFLEPRFCFISYVRPLCFPAVHLLCTIFIFCLPF